MKNAQEVYQDLLNQYQLLTDEEKNAILIYKSKLYVMINTISSIDDYKKLSPVEIKNKLPNLKFCESVLVDYYHTVNDPKNYFIKNTIFKDIHLDNLLLFIDDVKRILELLESASNTITLNDDLVVYRGFSTSNNQVDFLDRSLCISTSIKVDDAILFLEDGNQNTIKHLYRMKLNKGIHILVSPYSIVKVYDSVVDTMVPDSSKESRVLKVLNRGEEGQQEIILLNNNIEYHELSCDKVSDLNGEIYIHNIEVFAKDYQYPNHL